ncbi:MAG: PIN domain-containing protein [Chloroflexi bacterium]|nr:PIN domain-containing protein [Chloroflexota bacterium]
MKILLDTSVLVAGIVKTHSAHAPAVAWLQRAKERKFTGLVSVHSIAEIYHVITTLPVQPRISPVLAQELILHNVLDIFEAVSLSKEDYAQVIQCSQAGNLGRHNI